MTVLWAVSSSKPVKEYKYDICLISCRILSHAIKMSGEAQISNFVIACPCKWIVFCLENRCAERSHWCYLRMYQGSSRWNDNQSGLRWCAVFWSGGNKSRQQVYYRWNSMWSSKKASHKRVCTVSVLIFLMLHSQHAGTFRGVNGPNAWINEPLPPSADGQKRCKFTCYCNTNIKVTVAIHWWTVVLVHISWPGDITVSFGASGFYLDSHRCRA